MGAIGERGLRVYGSFECKRRRGRYIRESAAHFALLCYGRRPESHPVENTYEHSGRVEMLFFGDVPLLSIVSRALALASRRRRRDAGVAQRIARLLNVLIGHNFSPRVGILC
jgi:hypothetical protein